MKNDTPNWVFDDLQRLATMTRCTDVMDNGTLASARFPVANFFRLFPGSWCGLADRPGRYAYNIGTYLHAHYWAGYDGNDLGHRNLFDFVPPEVLDDARHNRALIVIDNLLEGFHDDRLYGFLHESCSRYELRPANIVYMTGNEMEPRLYAQWADARSVIDRVGIIAFSYWEECLHYHTGLHTGKTPLTWQDHLSHKASDARVLDYNCLNSNSRWHREYLMLRLVEEGLQPRGLISHRKLIWHPWEPFGIRGSTLKAAESLLPLTIDSAANTNYGGRATEVNGRIYLDTWISVVTETYGDEADSFFISEKTFKPIYAMHPFMVLGPRGILSRLRSMGYRTFDGLIDESYDDASVVDRVEIIVSNLKAIAGIRDKLGWFEQFRDVCQHNQECFLRLNFYHGPTYDLFMDIYDRLDQSQSGH